MGETTLLTHLRRARDHMDRHYESPLDLDQVARVAHVSKYHFARRFDAVYGETPIRYLTRRRIERAQDLLRSANLTVTEVCMAVGFTSLGSFSSRFTALVGEAPTAYRDRWAARGGPHVPGCWLFMRGVLDPQSTGTPAGAKPPTHPPAGAEPQAHPPAGKPTGAEPRARRAIRPGGEQSRRRRAPTGDDTVGA